MEKPVIHKKFSGRGFYLHASWMYKYPFAVRRWSYDDFDGMFRLLQAMGMDKVMIWPMTEIIPPPLSPQDRVYLIEFRKVLKNATDLGLECWLVFTPSVSTTKDVRKNPMQERVFYPNRQVFRFDDEKQYKTYISHLGDLLGCLNNADGYVFIDGDPGGYPGAQPGDFMRMLHDIRKILNTVGNGTPQKIIPWIWCGWGQDPENGWSDTNSLRKAVAPFIEAFKETKLDGPWELLPGRSNPNRANERINFELVETAGLMDRSTLLTYECVELEPTPPAFVLQFDQIRQVIREELYNASVVKGIMANAQQPICALHNLFYFSQCTADPTWLDRTDEEVLVSYAEFLGGDPSVLVPALSVANKAWDITLIDLPGKIRNSTLQSQAAQWLPGGPHMYLDVLAAFAESHTTVRRNTQKIPGTSADVIDLISSAAIAMLKWWDVHRYVGSGHLGSEYKWEFTNEVTLGYFYNWVQKHIKHLDEHSKDEIIERMAATGLIERPAAETNLKELISWCN